MNLYSKLIDKKIVYNGDFLKMRVDEIKLPNEKISSMEFIEHSDAACVLAIDDDNNILMVKQYRYPISQIMYEVPAGKMDENETPIECANRELEEETGYKAEKLELIGEIYTAPAYSTEKIYIYLASGLTQGKVNLDDDEFLECEKINFEKVLNMILNNEIDDAKTQIAILKYLAIKR